MALRRQRPGPAECKLRQSKSIFIFLLVQYLVYFYMSPVRTRHATPPTPTPTPTPLKSTHVMTLNWINLERHERMESKRTGHGHGQRQQLVSSFRVHIIFIANSNNSAVENYADDSNKREKCKNDISSFCLRSGTIQSILRHFLPPRWKEIPATRWGN